MTRISALFPAAALLLALTGCGGNDPGPTVAAPPSAGPAASALPAHLDAGQSAQIADASGAAAVVVSEPKIVKAPEDWSDKTIVVAMVQVQATQGTVTYAETSFALVTPDGTHVGASAVASDEGLPGRALGSGSLATGGKAKGLVTFSAPVTTLAGATIQLSTDPAGHDWKLG